jgi:POT family proton-dependent oligopeptide transporter
VVDNFVDRPTSDPAEARYLIDNGKKLQIRGNEDNSISLLDNGVEARRLPEGALQPGAERNPLTLAIMLIALSLISVGNGFFKPNISTIVGTLYDQGDRRRDSGFTIFYMGINLGSIGGQLFCPLLADYFGWWAGLSLAGVGMLISYALIQFDGGRLSGYGERPADAPNRDILIYIGALLAVPVLVFLFNNLMNSAPAEPGSGFIG